MRRETASNYLKAAGIEVHPPGRRGTPRAAKPAIQVITDSEAAKSVTYIVNGVSHTVNRSDFYEPVSGGDSGDIVRIGTTFNATGFKSAIAPL